MHRSTFLHSPFTGEVEANPGVFLKEDERTPGEILIAWQVPDDVSNELSGEAKIALVKYLREHFMSLCDLDPDLLRQCAETIEKLQYQG